MKHPESGEDKKNAKDIGKRWGAVIARNRAIKITGRKRKESVSLAAGKNSQNIKRKAEEKTRQAVKGSNMPTNAHEKNRAGSVVDRNVPASEGAGKNYLKGATQCRLR